MGTVISNLKARFGVDTSDFKKGLKDGEKATEDFKGAAGDQLEKFAEMFGVNMSGVTDALSTANKSLSFLGQSFKGAAKGGDILAISMKFLKFALVATGIGALVVILGSVIAYFTKSGEGADKFAKVLAQLKSVLNNVVERLVVFGKGIVDFISGKFAKGIEEMGSAFKGMGAEIKEDWKAAGALADAEDALEDREIALISSLEERRAKSAELRRLAKEETEDQKKKLSLLEEAKKVINSVYTDEISLEKERLRIMKAKLAIQTSDPTDEQRREIAEQEAKINGLYRERNVELKGLARETNTVAAAVKKEFEQFKSFSNIKMPQLLDKKIYDNINTSLKELHHTFVALKEVSSALFDVLGKIDISPALNAALENLSISMGEFFGSFIIGDKDFKERLRNEKERLRIMKEELAVQSGDNADAKRLQIIEQEAKINDLLRERPTLGKTIVGSFADLAVSVGKIIIAMAIAKAGIEKALLIPGAWPIALAAGVALVALGTALRGSMSAASASGGGGSAALSGSPGSTYDTRTSANAFQLSFPKTITLVAKGGDLVEVLNIENRRRNTVT